MELVFSTSGQVGVGKFPSLVHHSDNTVMLFWVDADGRLCQKNIKQESADYNWRALQFGDPDYATRDMPLRYARIKQIPRMGAFGVWVKDDVDINDLPIETQRFGIFDPLSDLTEYIDSGRIQMSNDNVIYSLQLQVENPKERIASEDRAMITPGMKIELFLNYGDGSFDYPMGVFYIDRVDYSKKRKTVSIDARSAAGKLLKDQQLNELYKFSEQQAYRTIGQMLEHASVENYTLEMPALDFSAGYEFDPSISVMDAINKVMETSTDYKMFENLDGKFYLTSSNFSAVKNLFSGYAFDRNKLISRQITRDDNEVYSKLCVQSEGDVYYVRTEPFTTSENYLALEKAENMKARLKEDRGWDAVVGSMDMNDARYRVYIGHFGTGTITPARQYLDQFGIYYTVQYDNDHGKYFIRTGGFGNAYGMTGRERAQAFMEELNEKRRKDELQEWYMLVELETEKKKWYRLWIGHFSKDKPETLKPAMYWLKNYYPAIGTFSIFEEKYVSAATGADMTGWVIKSKEYSTQAQAQSISNEIKTLKGWYSEVHYSGSVINQQDTQPDGTTVSWTTDTRKWRVEIKHFSKAYEGSLDKAKEFLDSFSDIEWYSVGEDKTGFYIVTNLYGDRDGKTAYDRAKEVQAKLEQQTRAITQTDKGWYSYLDEMERDTEEEAWRLRIMHFNVDTVLGCEYYLAQNGIYYTREIDPSVPTDGVAKPSNVILVTGARRNLNNKTGEERILEMREELLAQGWWSTTERIMIAKLDYYLKIGPIVKHEIDDVKTYLATDNILCDARKDGDNVMPILEFRTIRHEFEWDYATEKCYYFNMAKDTPHSVVVQVADALRDQFNRSGKIETFESSLVPQMIAGDGATINKNGRTEYIGAITDVTHQFGRNGYKTQFTVDSGERKGREKLSDYFVKTIPEVRRTE